MPSCIIIGAGTGVSNAIARRFGKGGYRIGLISRSADKLADLVDPLLRDGVDATWAVADAGNLPELEAAIAKVVAHLGGCDVLIYNAAVLQAGDPLDITAAQIEREFSINVLGAYRAAQLLAPMMIKQGRGAILLTGGGLALEPFPEWTSLALGKAALRSLGISLFKHLSPKGVHVSVLAICGIIKAGGAFDPDLIAQEYWRVATAPRGLEDREVIFQPQGTDPLYNDPERRHADTTILPAHAADLKET